MVPPALAVGRWPLAGRPAGTLAFVADAVMKATEVQRSPASHPAGPPTLARGHR
jgi:hypothetical protein